MGECIIQYVCENEGWHNVTVRYQDTVRFKNIHQYVTTLRWYDTVNFTRYLYGECVRF